MESMTPHNGAEVAGENNRAHMKNDTPDVHNQQGNKKMSQRVRNAMSLVCHLLIVGLTVYILYISFKSYQTFSWHPACLVIGSVALMSEAIMTLSPDNVLLGSFSRQQRVQAHWILQVLSAGFILVGFIVEVVIKNNNNASHFVSNHAILGLVYVILTVLTNCGGVAANYSMKLKRLAKPTVVKMWHIIFGLLTFAFGIVAFITGLYTRFFTNSAGYAAQVTCTVLLVVVVILTLEHAARSAYSRVRTLYLR